MSFSNFNIQPAGTHSLLALDAKQQDFASLCQFVAALPYGRNRDRADFELVLREGRGTCSSKHAFLQSVILENNQPEWKLVLGLYRMQEANTPGVGSVLEKYGLPFIPEAHCYLKFDGQRFDFTKPQTDIRLVEKDLLEEQEIHPAQVVHDKVAFHQNYLREYVRDQTAWPDFEEVWLIREACIAALAAS